MDFERIRSLVDLVSTAPIEELVLEEDGARLHLRKSNSASPGEVAATLTKPQPAASISLPLASVHLQDHAVRAFMPGTVYLGPTPGAPAFVSEGAAVTVGQTLAIIEAMKTMTPVTCGKAGTITAIRVSDSDVVSEGDVIFEVRATGEAEA